MKKLLFVSAGRCGTARIAEILKQYLPEEFSVQHQMPFSRLANIVGNLLYYFGQSETIKKKLYIFIISRYAKKKHFVCTDPLTSMIIPQEYIQSPDVCIIHLTREPNAFAQSFFNHSRVKSKSFIAHNFIPFWQIGIWPFENLFNKNIKKKYMKIIALKNAYFDEKYASNPYYKRIDINEVFNTQFLKNIIFDYFNCKVPITEGDLKIKTNSSHE